MKSPKSHEFRWIDNRCKGCINVVDGRCKVYIDPPAWWDRYGHCPLATHTNWLITPSGNEEKMRVGQQKQRKV